MPVSCRRVAILPAFSMTYRSISGGLVITVTITDDISTFLKIFLLSFDAEGFNKENERRFWPQKQPPGSRSLMIVHLLGLDHFSIFNRIPDTFCQIMQEHFGCQHEIALAFSWLIQQ